MSKLRRQLMMGVGYVPPTPPTPVQIEYLENTGSAYIDTHYHISSYNFKFEIKYMQLENSSAIAWLIYQFNGNNEYLAIYSNASNKLAAVWGNQWKASSTLSDRNAHVLILESKKLYRDGTVLFTTNNPSSFVSSTNTVRTGEVKMRIYYIKIWYNGTLVRNMIPMRIGQEGYMYDQVSGEYFGNAGTGDFILGNDVNT